MIRSQRGRNQGNARAALYAVLCVLVTVVGWMSVMMLAPADAGALDSPASFDDRTAAGTPTTGESPSVAPPPSSDGTPLPQESPPDPAATPTRVSFQIDIYRPNSFVSQMNRDYCMAGAVQNMMNIIGPTVDLTTAHQQQIGDQLVSLTTYDDSRNGGFGPLGWALIMPKLGGGQYKLVIDSTFNAAMKDAALALSETSRPVGLLTWWGAHSWVMTGFKSDSDPLQFPKTFKLNGAFIVDPFYPRVSSIWGQTLGPDTYRDMTAMAHNYIGWKRPEGSYPARDGKWLLVIPVDSPAGASPSTSPSPGSSSP